MFTVLLLSDTARAVFDDGMKAYFEPFEDAGRIAFCDWNQSPTADTLAAAVPDLADAIRGQRSWRAIVIDHPLFSEAAASGRDPENPFDYLDNRSTELNLADSTHPLVRLAHILLGYPDLGAKDFEPVVRFTRPDEADPRELSEVELAGHPEFEGTTFEEALEILMQEHIGVKVHYREVDYGDDEQERHRILRERYGMKEVRPSEVIFVATRLPVDHDSKTLLRRAWRTEFEQSAARFVDRNDYPPMSRFAVFDLRSPQNSGYEHELLRFWLSVLTVAVNPLPGSAFQGDKVYRLDVELGLPVLGELLNGHISKLTSVREYLESLINQPQRPPSTALADLLKPQKVQVDFERLGGYELGVSTTGYGLASDAPRNETVRWREEVSHVVLDAERFVRKPRRVLARAVFDARARASAFRSPDHPLSDIEREELEDELAQRMHRLVEPATTDILDRERLRATLARHGADVAGYIHERMPARTIAAAGGLVLAVWIGALAPYLVQAAGVGPAVLGGSALVLALALLLMGATVLVALLVMRRRLLDKIGAFNRAMRSFVSEVNGGAGVFADYLSQVATYMHARAMLIGATDQLDEVHARLRRLKVMRARVVHAIGVEKRLVTSIGTALEVQRLTTGFSDLDVDNEAQFARLFRFPVGDGTAEFNRSGELVKVPYEFVTRLLVERVALYDGSGSRSGTPAP